MKRPQISTYRLGSPRTKQEGLRLGTVRHLPRGVPRSEYAKRDLFDVWLPLLAPSRELLATFLDGKKTPQQFFRAYRAEMQRPEARHTIELLAAISRVTPLAVGCFCEDESRCHRSVLIELIRTAAKRQ
jgi:uncharacterized protein YeaO (DUF488 family)